MAPRLRFLGPVFERSSRGIMTKRIFLSGLMWCLTSLPATACYLIQTKGSGEFKTSAYWREGGEIKFYLGEGVMGVSSSDIQRISKLPVNGHNPCVIRLEPSSIEDSNGGNEADDHQQIHAVQTNQAAPSEAYLRFEAEVAGVERGLQRLGIMPTEELVGLAKTCESLKRRMLETQEAAAMNPLLVRVYAALEKVESMIHR